MKHLFNQISDVANRIVEVVGVFLMAVLIFVIGAEVVARYVFNSSLSWSEEFGRVVFVWVIFLGASIGFKRGAHMGLHFIVGFAPERIKKVISTVSLLFCSVFFLFMVVEGFGVTARMTSQLTPAMAISMAWQFSAIPVGALFMLVHVPALLLQSEKAGVTYDMDTPS